MVQRTVLVVLCCAVLLVTLFTGCSVDEPEDDSTDSRTGQVSVADGIGTPDKAIAPAELELRRGVVLVASDGEDFRAIGLTETITDLETGRYSKTIEVRDRVTTIVSDKATAYVGSDDQSHWIRFDSIRLKGPTLLPVDAFTETFDTPADPGTSSVRRTGTLSPDGKQLVIDTVEDRTSGRRVQTRTIVMVDVGAVAVAEISEPAQSDGELPAPRLPRSSIPAEAIFASQGDSPLLGSTSSLRSRGLVPLLSSLMIRYANAQTAGVVCELGDVVNPLGRPVQFEIICRQDGVEVHRGETIPCGYYDWYCSKDRERDLDDYAAVVEEFQPGEVSSFCAQRLSQQARPVLGPDSLIHAVTTVAAERAVCRPRRGRDGRLGSLVTADPHIVTADGVAYNFQSGGEFVLYRRGQFEVQQRYEGVPGRASSTQASAVHLDGHLLEVVNSETRGTNDVGVPVRIDGLKTRLNEEGVYFDNGALIARESGGFGRTVIAVSPRGEVVRIESGSVSQDVTLFLLEDAQESGGGLAGTPNGRREDDFVTREGDQVSMSDILTVDGLYLRFGESWRVSEKERLFTDRPFDDFRTEEYLRPPDRYPSLALFSAEERLEAEDRCRAAGVPNGPALKDCTFDMLADPSQDWASQAASSSATVVKNASDVSASRTLSQVPSTTKSAVPLSALDSCLAESCAGLRESRTNTNHVCHGIEWLVCDYRGLDTSKRQICQRSDGVCERDDQCCGGMSCNDRGLCVSGKRGDRCSSTSACGGQLLCLKDGQELGHCGT